MHLNNLLITRTTWFPCYEFDLPRDCRGLIKFKKGYDDNEYYYVDTDGVSIIPIKSNDIFDIFLNLKEHLDFTLILGSEMEIYIVMKEIKKILPFQDVTVERREDIALYNAIGRMKNENYEVPIIHQDRYLSFTGGYSLRLINKECNKKEIDEYKEKCLVQYYEYPTGYFNHMVKKDGNK